MGAAYAPQLPHISGGEIQVGVSVSGWFAGAYTCVSFESGERGCCLFLVVSASAVLTRARTKKGRGTCYLPLRSILNSERERRTPQVEERGRREGDPRSQAGTDGGMPFSIQAIQQL
jgi:hypothetical protein